MSERNVLTRQTAARYRRSTKKQKRKILVEFDAATNTTRKCAGWILRDWGKKRIVHLNGEVVELVVGRRRKKRRKPREGIYDEEVFQALKKVCLYLTGYQKTSGCSF